MSNDRKDRKARRAAKNAECVAYNAQGLAWKASNRLDVLYAAVFGLALIVGILMVRVLEAEK